MPVFKLQKLVRDKIVEDQIALGQKPDYRTLDPIEHKHELIRKIIEEIQELSDAASEDAAKEIADVQQALDDLIEVYGLSKADVGAAQQKKNDKSGAFKKGIYIDTLELAEDDPWTAYYRKEPERFPEIG